MLIGLGGALQLLGLALLLLRPLSGQPSFVQDFRSAFAAVVAAAFGIGYCLTGVWLFEARRRGAYLAAGVLTLNVVSALFGAVRYSGWNALMPLASLLGLVLAWPYLSDEGRELDERVTVMPRE